MPGFIDMYVELQKEYQQFIQKKAPDAGIAPREFMDYGIEKRKLERKISAYRGLLIQQNLPLGDIEQAVRDSMGPAGEKFIQNAGKGMNFKKDLEKQLQQNMPELYNSLFAKSTDQPGPTIDTLLNEGKIPQKYIDIAKNRNLLRSVIGYEDRTEQNINFLNSLKKRIDPQVSDQLADTASNYKDILDRPVEERLFRPYESRVNELKEKMPQNMDQKQKEAYLQALDFAASHITTPHTSLRDEMTVREQQGVEKVESRRSEQIVKETTATFKGGKYNDLHENAVVRGETYELVKEEKTKNLGEMLEEHVTLSETTKQGIRDIFKKMDEMHLMDYGVEENGESLFKIYGFNKLMKEKTVLEKALNAEDPDPEAITKASNAYQKTWGDMQELFQIAKDHFSTDETFFPGNMDSIRNASVPYEFTGDLMTTAQVNSVFLTYATLKNNNLDLETYLENPTGNLYRSIINGLEEDSFEKKCKDVKSFDDTLDFLTGSGRFAGIKDQFSLKHLSYGEGRSMLGPTLLERDQNVKAGNLVLTDLLDTQKNRIINGQLAKYTYLHAKLKDNERVTKAQDKANVSKTLENLLVASDKDRNINACLGGLPETDMHGKVIGEAFDADKYIREQPADYDGLIERAQKIHNKCVDEVVGREKSFAINGIGKDEYLEMAQNTYAKVLAAHEAERGTPGYDKLEQEFLVMSNKLSEKADPELRSRMEKTQKDHLDRLLSGIDLTEPRPITNENDIKTFNAMNQRQANFKTLAESEYSTPVSGRGLEYDLTEFEYTAAEMIATSAVRDGIQNGDLEPGNAQRQINKSMSNLCRNADFKKWIKEQSDDFRLRRALSEKSPDELRRAFVNSTDKEITYTRDMQPDTKERLAQKAKRAAVRAARQKAAERKEAERQKAAERKEAEQKASAKAELTTMERFSSSLSRFNTARASIFKKESDEHKEMREAAEKLQESLEKLQKETVTENGKTREMTQKEMTALGVETHGLLKKLKEKTERYIAHATKNGRTPNTPAGKERLAGARELQGLFGRLQSEIFRDPMVEAHIAGEKLPKVAKADFARMEKKFTEFKSLCITDEGNNKDATGGGAYGLTNFEYMAAQMIATSTVKEAVINGKITPGSAMNQIGIETHKICKEEDFRVWIQNIDKEELSKKNADGVRKDFTDALSKKLFDSDAEKTKDNTADKKKETVKKENNKENKKETKIKTPQKTQPKPAREVEKVV
ncbi:MAG: hypothetical protein IJ147_01430 [Lachnospiraceae bacterium]|nr:hypothetical protein [Lachnospiraceae bacterium]